MRWAREVNPSSGERFARSAIRCGNVDTFSGSCAPGMFPSHGSVTWHSLPSLGSFRVQFPESHGTVECSDFLRPSRHASLPSRGATRRCARRFVPGGPDAGPRAGGSSSGPRLPDRVAWRRPGSPRFLRNPPVPLPCSPTPAGPTRQALRRRRRGPRYVHNEGSHDHYSFGAQSHGFGTRCLRFVRCLATRDASLTSRCWPLCGAGLVTRRTPRKGFR